MNGIIEKLINKYWLKLISIPLVLILFTVGGLGLIPNDITKISYKEYALLAVFLIIALIYSVLTIKQNVLPKANDMMNSVLFVIDAEGEQFYKDIEKKLVSEFKDRAVVRSHKGFKPICVDVNRIKSFNFNDKDSMVELLHQVNCILVVYVKHRVDSITNAENFVMQINCGVLHPDFNDKARALLRLDMCNLSASLRKRTFKKSSTIDEMFFAAKQLSIICNYVVGLVMLLVAKPAEAYDRFHMLKSLLKNQNPDDITPGFNNILNNRLLESCMLLVDNDCNAFYLDRDKSALEDMNKKLDEINSILPDTYEYYEGKAYYYVAQNSDICAAKECIKKCKQYKKRTSWRYSEAFIAAYENRTPMIIYKKYSQAFRHDQSLTRIVDYIEYMLEQEPARVGLHFAAGLVYNNIGQERLAREHFDCYFAVNNDNKIKQVLTDKGIWSADKVA